MNVIFENGMIPVANENGFLTGEFDETAQVAWDGKVRELAQTSPKVKSITEDPDTGVVTLQIYSWRKIRHQAWLLTQENPDFQYAPVTTGAKYLCSYSGGPRDSEGDIPEGFESAGCIFGQAIRRAEPELFAKIAQCVDLRIDGIVSIYCVDYRPEELEKARDIQKRQDRGALWGSLDIPSEWRGE